MEEQQQQRRLEIIETCLNNLEGCIVCGRCTEIIAEAQRQLEKLLSGDMPPLFEVPISPAAAAEAKRHRKFPHELVVWFNEQLVEAFNETDEHAIIYTTTAPNRERNKSWLTLDALREVYEHVGWDVRYHTEYCFVFSKRDEKQASSIN